MHGAGSSQSVLWDAEVDLTQGSSMYQQIPLLLVATSENCDITDGLREDTLVYNPQGHKWASVLACCRQGPMRQYSNCSLTRQRQVRSKGDVHQSLPSLLMGLCQQRIKQLSVLV